jgi:hypothetical protein
MYDFKKIRKDAGVKLNDVAEEFLVSRQFVWCCERGDKSMPINMQVYYLSLRGNQKDLIVIEYLNEILNLKRKRINEE